MILSFGSFVPFSLPHKTTLLIQKRKERMSLPVFNKEKMAYCSLASPTNSVSWLSQYTFLYMLVIYPLCILINVGGELNYHNGAASVLHCLAKHVLLLFNSSATFCCLCSMNIELEIFAFEAHELAMILFIMFWCLFFSLRQLVCELCAFCHKYFTYNKHICQKGK